MESDKNNNEAENNKSKLENIIDFLSTKHNNEEFAELTDNFGFINKWIFAKPYNYLRSRPVKAPKKFVKFADYTFGAVTIANGPNFEQEIYGQLTGTKPKYLTMGSGIFNELFFVGGGMKTGENMDMNSLIYTIPLTLYSGVCITRFILAAKNDRGYQDLSFKRIILNLPSNYKYIHAKMQNIDLTKMSLKYVRNDKDDNYNKTTKDSYKL